MQKVYQRINWENDPSTNTPINEYNLNQMDYALDKLDDRIINLAGYEERAKISEENAKASEENSDTKSQEAENSAILAQSYAIGGTGTRENEDVANAKYYYEQSERIAQGLSGTLLPCGTISFEELADVQALPGYMYNISNEFVSDERFIHSDIYHGVGANIYMTIDGKWDVLAGSNVLSVNGKTGIVILKAEDVGAVALGGDVAENTVTYTEVKTLDELTEGEKLSDAFGKIKLAVKNVISIVKLLGNTDISKIGDGTVTGALGKLNSDLFKFQTNVTDANLFYNGIASCSANSIANCPSPHGVLIAYRNPNGLIGSQFFIGYQNTGCWYRDVTNDSTREWEKIATNSDLKNKKMDILHNMFESGDMELNVGTIINLTHSVFDYDEVRIYCYVDGIGSRKFCISDNMQYMYVDQGNTNARMCGGLYYDETYNCYISLSISADGKSLIVQESKHVGYNAIRGCIIYGIKY